MITKQSESEWQKIEQKIIERTPASSKAYIWGGGIHTSHLFANTCLLDHLEIVHLIDSSENKWGTSIGNVKCISPEKLHAVQNEFCIISSQASELEISRAAKKYFKEERIVRLYD